MNQYVFLIDTSTYPLEVKIYYQYPAQSGELLCMGIVFSNKASEWRLTE